MLEYKGNHRQKKHSLPWAVSSVADINFANKFSYYFEFTVDLSSLYSLQSIRATIQNPVQVKLYF